MKNLHESDVAELHKEREAAIARIAELEAALDRLKAALEPCPLEFGRIIAKHTQLDPDNVWETIRDDIRARAALSPLPAWKKPPARWRPWHDYLTDEERATLAAADGAKVRWLRLNKERAAITRRAIQRAKNHARMTSMTADEEIAEGGDPHEEPDYHERHQLAEMEIDELKQRNAELEAERLMLHDKWSECARELGIANIEHARRIAEIEAERDQLRHLLDTTIRLREREVRDVTAERDTAIAELEAETARLTAKKNEAVQEITRLMISWGESLAEITRLTAVERERAVRIVVSDLDHTVDAETIRRIADAIRGAT